MGAVRERFMKVVCKYPVMPDGNGTEQASFSIKEALQSELQTVFRDKSLLRSDKIVDEDRIVGRDSQLSEVIRLLKAALHDEPPEDMLLYGPSGTGKSLIMGAVSQQVVQIADNEGKQIAVVEINGRTIKSEDKAVWNIVEQIAHASGVNPGIPKNGISTTDKYDRLFELVEERLDLAILTLDELDLLWGKGRAKTDTAAFADLLYNLTRADRIGGLDGQITISVLTNNANAIENNLDSRSESTFGPQKILFPDYDANQIGDILEHRRDAFHDDVLTTDAIPLAAAFGAEGDGDARKAIDLIRSAGNIADRNGDEKVTESHVRQAQEKVEEQYTLEIIETMSIQKKAVLYSAALIDHFSKQELDGVPGPVIYDIYQDLCEEDHLDERSVDSVRRWMREFDTMGVVEPTRTTRGRGKGAHMEYSLDNDAKIVIDTIAGTENRFQPSDEYDEFIRRKIHRKIKSFYDA